MKTLWLVATAVVVTACGDSTGPPRPPNVAGSWKMTIDITLSSSQCHEAVDLLLSQSDTIAFSGFSQSWVETCSSGIPDTIPQQDMSGSVSRPNVVGFADTDHGSGVPIASFSGTVSNSNRMSGTVTSSQANNPFTGTWSAVKQ